MNVAPSLPWQHSVLQGLRMIKREKQQLSTIALLCAMMLLIQLLLGMFVVLQEATSSLTERIGIHIQLQDNASQQKLQQLYSALNAHSAVSEAEFVSKEEILALEQKKDPELASFMLEYDLANPFHDSIKIILHSSGNIQELSALLSESQWENTIDTSTLSNISERRQEVSSLLEAVSALRTAAGTIAILSLLLLVGIVIELVRRAIAEQKDEWAMQRLLGASQLNLLLPTITKMAILLAGALIVAVIISMSLWWLIAQSISSGSPSTFTELLTQAINSIYASLPYVLLGELALILVVSTIGTMLGIGHIRSS